ncbi:MCM family protein (plasmid) [Methanocaldococcus fervens AG86]|uniref:MCM family protein n=1 Tax=Methanocaldococcus fervens (strain DSM 4213 / JCM 15782 / AG86) TaxID=573064 RepID=C7P9Q6_METFA|nr:MCM family protein [Methanocaldococcus fervens AG86]
MIEEGIIKEEGKKGEKTIVLIKESDSNVDIGFGFSSFDDEIIFEEVRGYLVNYFRNIHKEDIICKNNFVVIDLNHLYSCGLMEFVEFVVNNPERGLKFLKECYEEAYYSLNVEYLPEDFTLTVKNIPKALRVINTIEEIRKSHKGKLIEFEGIIAVASKVKGYTEKKCFVCQKCGYEWLAENNLFDPIKIKKCPRCGGDVVYNEEKSIDIDIQELKVQQPLEQMKNPDENPKYITVILKNSPGIYSGRVRIVGVVRTYKSTKKNIDVKDYYVEGWYVEKVDENENISISEEDKRLFEKLAKRKDVIDLLSDRLIPEIKGHEHVKKAIFLQQVKGTKKRSGRRHNIHILLVADPGVGKTQMLRRIAKIPGNVYSSVTTATAVGLTAAVEREKTEIGDNTWVVKPGVLVKANGGTACIDELDKKKDVHTAVLEAVESQTIHVNKGGINAKLPAECAVLAACNPKWGKFNPDVSIAEQINIYTALLDRFDLIFPIRNVSDKDRDREIADHITSLAIYDSIDEEVEGYDYITVEVDGEEIKIDFDFVVKYIMYARQKKAILSKEAKEVLDDWYVEMRKKHEITARQLEGAVRLAEAHAKARLKDIVEVEDAEEAITMITECLKEIAYDPETGIFDVDKILGMSKKERDKLSMVYEIIKKLAEKSELVEHEDVVKEVEKRGLGEKELKQIIDKLKKYGEIDEPRPGRYRLI